TADGRYVVFVSSDNLLPADNNNTEDIYLRDRTTGQLSLISVNSAGTGSANNFSYDPTISADGTLVAFASYATDLSPLASNGNSQIYLRNLVTNVTTLVSVNSAGTNGGNGYSYDPIISANSSYSNGSFANGSVVAWISGSTDLYSVDTDSGDD